ncbi:MAG: nucleoside monophosphate kinase [Promethearchaeia archaeon]
MKRIVLFGPPGAGKGTFSSQILKVFPEINHISTGDIFRDNLKNQTPLGLKAKSYMDKGELVPDSLTNELVKDRLDKIVGKSWLLDGYPRNLKQAEFLDKITNVDLLLLLEVGRDVIKKRILGRFGCPECGEIYNKYTLQPKVQTGENKWTCDRCGAEIEFKQRSDDTEETLKNRLDAHEKNAKPVIDYYEKKGLVKKVDAENTLGLTEGDIKKILEL